MNLTPSWRQLAKRIWKLHPAIVFAFLNLGSGVSAAGCWFPKPRWRRLGAWPLSPVKIAAYNFVVRFVTCRRFGNYLLRIISQSVSRPPLYDNSILIFHTLTVAATMSKSSGTPFEWIGAWPQKEKCSELEAAAFQARRQTVKNKNAQTDENFHYI